MKATRRDFVKTTAVAGAGTVLGLSLSESRIWAAGAGMKILVLGGTGFLGPHIVECARPRGHVLTLFNRGKTNPGLFKDVEQLHGDRDGKLDALEGRSWDAVIDTSGYVPRIVKMSADLLAPSVKQYVFISTISVYSDNSKPGMDESGPLEKVADPKNEEVMKNYGGLKALCEQAAEASMPGRATTIRPGLIVGPMDPTDRFTYWPVRVAKGGDVLAPGDGTDPVQIVDARDLAAFVVRSIEDRFFGIYNATGPASEMSMKTMLEACKAASGSDAKFVWADAKFLEERKVAPWSDMPAWLPGTGETAGFARINCKKAISKGLAFRPIKETAADTLAWWKTLPAERSAKPKSGISPEREAEVLAAWKERASRGSIDSQGGTAH
jgi:2'-hydroxyisoflavone reductase